MDELLNTEREFGRQLSLTILTPPNTGCPLTLAVTPIREIGRFQGYWWEQVELPRHAGPDLLLNLCNTAPLLGTNMVATVHDASVYAVPSAYSVAFRTWYRTMIPIVGRRARRLVTVSDFSRHELERYARIDHHRMTTIPNGGEHIHSQPADAGVFERLALSRRYVLAVSSQSRHKNLNGIVAALEYLPHRDFDVVFAGGSDPRIFSHGAICSGAIRLAGYVTDAELRALYENAECFVYPSFYEGFGLPPLEAMTCGCPVVVSRAASLPEVCGDAAVYCDPRDPADIARAVARVTGDPGLQEDLRYRGRARASRFTWKNAARSLLDLLANVSLR